MLIKKSFLLLTALISLSGAWHINALAAQPQTVGIDVSHYQGTINWSSVKSNSESVAFTFIKATGGTEFVDSQFTNNWSGSYEEGILHGAYHFFYPNLDAKQQAEHFLSIVGKHIKPKDLPPVLDVEITDGVSSEQLVADVKTWLTTVEQALGCKPILYVDESFANEHFGNHFSGYDLWLAEYNSNSQPQLPTGWKTWQFWQYSQTGTVSGINGEVDTDRFNGSVRKLQAYAKKANCQLKAQPKLTSSTCN